MDGLGSHDTAQFDNICKANMIIPICMSPHSSHLQPLDIGCFVVIKRVYEQMVQTTLGHRVHDIARLDIKLRTSTSSER